MQDDVFATLFAPLSSITRRILKAQESLHCASVKYYTSLLTTFPTYRLGECWRAREGSPLNGSTALCPSQVSVDILLGMRIVSSPEWTGWIALYPNAWLNPCNSMYLAYSKARAARCCARYKMLWSLRRTTGSCYAEEPIRSHQHGLA